MEELTRLVAIDAIKTLKARYFRCVDTKDWTGLAATFAPDIEFDRRGAHSLRGATLEPRGEDICRGASAVLAMVRRAVEPFVTVHRGFMPELIVHSDHAASGIWGMEDCITDTQGVVVVHGIGFYHDTYQRLATGWVIRTSRIERLMLRTGTPD